MQTFENDLAVSPLPTASAEPESAGSYDAVRFNALQNGTLRQKPCGPSMPTLTATRITSF